MKKWDDDAYETYLRTLVEQFYEEKDAEDRQRELDNEPPSGSFQSEPGGPKFCF